MGRSNTVTITVTQPAKRKSILTVSVSPSSGTAPLTVTITGQLLDQDGYTPLPNRTVKLYINDTYVSSASTDMRGNVTFSYTFKDVGTYSIYLAWDGDEYYEGCEEESEW